MHSFVSCFASMRESLQIFVGRNSRLQSLANACGSCCKIACHLVKVRSRRLPQIYFLSNVESHLWFLRHKVRIDAYVVRQLVQRDLARVYIAPFETRSAERNGTRQADLSDWAPFLRLFAAASLCRYSDSSQFRNRSQAALACTDALASQISHRHPIPR